MCKRENIDLFFSLSLSPSLARMEREKGEKEREKNEWTRSLSLTPAFVLRLILLYTEEIYRETEKRADDDQCKLEKKRKKR